MCPENGGCIPGKGLRVAGNCSLLGKNSCCVTRTAGVFLGMASVFPESHFVPRNDRCVSEHGAFVPEKRPLFCPECSLCSEGMAIVFQGMAAVFLAWLLTAAVCLETAFVFTGTAVACPATLVAFLGAAVVFPGNCHCVSRTSHCVPNCSVPGTAVVSPAMSLCSWEMAGVVLGNGSSFISNGCSVPGNGQAYTCGAQSGRRSG